VNGRVNEKDLVKQGDSMSVKTTNLHQTHEAVDKHEAAKPVAPRSVELTQSNNLESLQHAVAAPGRALPADILALQHAMGNRAATRFIQTKLTVGPASDQYEQEADRVAEHVMNMLAPTQSQPAVQRTEEDEKDVQMKPLAASITPLVQRQCSEGTDLEKEVVQAKSEIQRSEVRHPSDGFEADGTVEDQLRAHQGQGSPLPGAVRDFMEPRFGADFSGVRIHTDASAAQLNRRLSAQAFTHGQDIYLGAGKYHPSAAAGKQLLAHELTHVIQQTGGVRRLAPGIQRITWPWSKKKKEKEISAPTDVTKMMPSADILLNTIKTVAFTDDPSLKILRQDLKFQGQLEAVLSQEQYDLAQWLLKSFADKAPDILKEIDAGGDPTRKWSMTKEQGLNVVVGKLTGDKFLRAIKALLTDPLKVKVRSDATLLTAYFQSCTNTDEKAELVYLLGGDADWKRTMFTTHGISQENYRAALVRLGVFETGAAGHLRGPEVDKLIQTHLKDFTKGAVNTGSRIAGFVAVLGAADWDVIGRSEYGDGIWDGGKKNTLNAFVDRSGATPRVFVNKDRGNAGTAIHEACHMWSHPTTPIKALSQPFNEGVTEYFARKVCSALNPPIPRIVYAQNYATAAPFAALVTDTALGKAYFDGDIAAIKTPFVTAKSEAVWTDFMQKTEAEKWAEAQALL
jgi:hypothetical protein